MARICCFSGIENKSIPMLTAILHKAGESAAPLIVHLNVTAVAQLAPALIICDVDGLDVDALEILRQLRFVLPGCVIAVYTGNLQRSWAFECHLAGANCLLAKTSTATALAAGLRIALRSGCFTDPHFTSLSLDDDSAVQTRVPVVKRS